MPLHCEVAYRRPQVTGRSTRASARNLSTVVPCMSRVSSRPLVLEEEKETNKQTTIIRREKNCLNFGERIVIYGCDSYLK